MGLALLRSRLACLDNSSNNPSSPMRSEEEACLAKAPSNHHSSPVRRPEEGCLVRHPTLEAAYLASSNNSSSSRAACLVRRRTTSNSPHLLALDSVRPSSSRQTTRVDLPLVRTMLSSRISQRVDCSAAVDLVQIIRQEELRAVASALVQVASHNNNRRRAALVAPVVALALEAQRPLPTSQSPVACLEPQQPLLRRRLEALVRAVRRQQTTSLHFPSEAVGLEVVGQARRRPLRLLEVCLAARNQQRQASPQVDSPLAVQAVARPQAREEDSLAGSKRSKARVALAQQVGVCSATSLRREVCLAPLSNNNSSSHPRAASALVRPTTRPATRPEACLEATTKTSQRAVCSAA